MLVPPAAGFLSTAEVLAIARFPVFFVGFELTKATGKKNHSFSKIFLFFMDFHVLSCVFTGLHGSSWVFMGLHGSSWVFMGLHGSSWAFMGLHVSSCVFFVFFDFLFFLQGRPAPKF